MNNYLITAETGSTQDKISYMAFIRLDAESPEKAIQMAKSKYPQYKSRKYWKVYKTH